MQEIWLQDLSWDDKLLIELCQRWNSFLQSNSVLDQVRKPRWVSFRPEFRVEHYGFCNASQKAYGAAIYVRVEVGYKTMVHSLTAYGASQNGVPSQTGVMLDSPLVRDD